MVTSAFISFRHPFEDCICAYRSFAGSERLLMSKSVGSLLGSSMATPPDVGLPLYQVTVAPGSNPIFTKTLLFCRVRSSLLSFVQTSNTGVPGTGIGKAEKVICLSAKHPRELAATLTQRVEMLFRSTAVGSLYGGGEEGSMGVPPDAGSPLYQVTVPAVPFLISSSNCVRSYKTPIHSPTVLTG